MSAVYRVDQPHVMHEMIDNEVVVINLDTGIYYSFEGVAGRIWQLLSGAGRSLDDVVLQMTREYQGERDHISAAVSAFLEQLCAEQLAIVATGEVSPTENGSESTAGSTGALFVDPVLQRYTDMETLLLADPIHEVDEGTGWPNVK